jgi:hydroxymethylbilane synthase
MLPAAGQGALAIECCENDSEAVNIAQSINDPPTSAATQAERALVRHLGGGCHTPIAALATNAGDRLRLRGAVLSPDGRHALRAESTGSADDPETLARTVAQELFKLGARELIAEE